MKSIVVSSSFGKVVAVVWLTNKPLTVRASHCCWITEYSEELYCDPNCDHSSSSSYRYNYDDDDDDDSVGMDIFLGVFFTLLFLFAFVIGPLWIVHRSMKRSECCWTGKRPVPNGIWSYCCPSPAASQDHRGETEKVALKQASSSSSLEQQPVSNVVDAAERVVEEEVVAPTNAIHLVEPVAVVEQPQIVAGNPKKEIYQSYPGKVFSA